MRYYDQYTFTTKSGRLWWNPDLLSRSGSVDCTAEPLDMTAIVPEGGSGDMVCAFDELVCHVYPYIPPPVFGDAVCTFEEPVVSLEPGRRVACVAQPWEFQSGIYVPGYGGVMDNCTFKEMKADWTGTSSFISMDLAFRRPDCHMGMGLGLDLECERLELSMGASTGLVAGLDAEMTALTFTAVAGDPPAMDCTFETPAAEIYGDTDIVLGLAVTMARPELSCEGRSDIVASLDLRSRPLFTSGWYSLSSGSSGDITAQLLQIYAGLAGVSGPVGDIDAGLVAPKIEMDSVHSGSNSINITINPPSIDLLVLTDCEEDETLKFEAA